LRIGTIRSRVVPAALRLALAVLVVLLPSCTNNPYPERDSGQRVLYMNFEDAPRTLDPAVAYTTNEHSITGKVYDTLLEYHYLRRPYELIAGLAEAVPQAEPLEGGQVRYRFRLREDLSFQEDPCFERFGAGERTRQITAADLVFQLKRIADPAVNSPVVEPFFNVVGFREYHDALAEARKPGAPMASLPPRELYERVGPIAGVREVDPLTIEIVLGAPYPQILYWFAMPFTTPLPWEAVHHYDGRDGRAHLADHPVGSGPFVLSHYDKQARIVLEKNPNWYGVQHPEWKAPGAVFPAEGMPEDAERGLLAAAGKPLPFIERIEYRREKERIPAFSKFLQGYYDASVIIRESFDRIVLEDRLSEEMQAMGMQLEKSVVPAIYYIGFNMEDRVVGAPAGERGKKLRQAMSLVVDAREYARLFMNGRGVPAESLLPPGIFGYEEDYRNTYRQLSLERAKALLAEAGYPDGIDPKTRRPLRLTFDVGSTAQDAILRFQFWVNAWRRLGLDVEVAATTYNKFQEKVRQGAYQIFTWGWVADYPDPENFMFLLWSKMARSVSGGPNTSNFNHPRFDELFLAMKTRENDDERLRLIREMVGILEDERPWIELFYPEDYELFHGWLENLKPAGLSIPTTKYYDIDPVLRQERREAWNKPVVWPAYLLAALFFAAVLPGVVTFFRERQ
jgi:oligopeptide transport system substrate-binding protein